jgi:hypothetical protein
LASRANRSRVSRAGAYGQGNGDEDVAAPHADVE